jgi:hypothetical protein
MSAKENLIEYASRRLKDPSGNFSIWGNATLENYKKVSKLPIQPTLAWIKPKDVMLFGVRGWDRLSTASRGNSHLVLRARDPLRLGQFPPSFNYDLKAYRQLYQAILTKDCLPLKDLEKKIIRVFDKVQPNVFLANCTIDPIGRLWIKEAGRRKVKTICLQHGIYTRSIPGYAQEEDIVDRYIALDDIQAKIISRNIPHYKIVTLGDKSGFQWESCQRPLRICLVGEDWERYGLQGIKKIIIQTYTNIVKNLSSPQFKFFYKPHPSEINSYGISSLVEITASVESQDVFIGFTSSLLKDMATKHKLAIQIQSQQVPADNFEVNGYCLSIDEDLKLSQRIKDILSNGTWSPCIKNNSLESLLSE